MTWIRDLAAAPTGWDAVAAEIPGPAGAAADLHRTVWASMDPVLLELCRLRLATLLGFEAGWHLRSDAARVEGLSEDKLATLSSWPTSPLFSERERACLALAEQFVIDANGVTDHLVASVLIMSEELREELQRQFTGRQLVELVFRLMQYSSDKVMVALGLDLPEEATGAGI